MRAGMVAGAVSNALFGGGKLVKAALVVTKKDKKGELTEVDKLEFPINPAEITISDKSEGNRSGTTGPGEGGKQGEQKRPREIKFSVVFDTYETREDVRKKYIQKLQKFSRIEDELHVPPTLIFTWGQLTADTEAQFPCDLEEFDVTYTMFLPDGTPVRCKVNIVLRDVTPPDQQAEDNASPDHAKLHTVRRGDTLESIAYREYDRASEWRRIADANGIDDPLRLEPGTRLLVPPILK